MIASSLGAVATAAFLLAAPEAASQGVRVASPEEIAAGIRSCAGCRFPAGHIVQMKLTGKPDAPAVRIVDGFAPLEKK